MKTAIDPNESEFEKLKREALEWLEKQDWKGRAVPPFIYLALENFTEAKRDNSSQVEAKEPVYKHNIGSTTDFKVEAKEVEYAEEGTDEWKRQTNRFKEVKSQSLGPDSDGDPDQF